MKHLTTMHAIIGQNVYLLQKSNIVLLNTLILKSFTKWMLEINSIYYELIKTVPFIP